MADSEVPPLWELERAVGSFTAGIRLVFAGVAGGVGYNVLTADLIPHIEIGLVLFLIAMVVVLEYGVRSLEQEFLE